MFSAETYADRRRRLKDTFRSGLLLFLGNEESPMNYVDNAYPFRQDSTFLYFFGIDLPGWSAVIDLDRDETVLYADNLSLDDIVWTGPQPTVAELAQRAGVTATAPSSALAERLGRSQGQEIHFLPPYRPEHRLKLSRWLNLAPEALDNRSSVPFIRAVVDLRSIKDAGEIAALEKAVDVSVDMHLAAIRMARPGVPESAIAARIAEIALAAGGNVGYPIIATVHGETLHNHERTHVLADGQMLLVDAGAETAMRYTGDLTSTCPVSPRFDPRQADIYQIVLDTHLGALDRLKTGVSFREVHLAACRTIAEGLKTLGLMKGDPSEAVAAGAHAMFFPCGLGHMLGLDVHDMENLGEVWVGYEGQPKSTQFGLKSLRLARPLQSGFVLTVEPGIYFIPTLMDRWKAESRFLDFICYDKLDAYRTFGGIRIEENVLITDTGHRILGKTRPRTLAEVEAAKG